MKHYSNNHSLTTKKQERQSILLPNGRTAGYIQGATFYKYVADKNILQHLPALCLDNGILFKLKRLGVKTILIKHKTDGTIWTLSLDNFLEKAFSINRGNAGSQKCVCLSQWHNSNEPTINKPTKPQSYKSSTFNEPVQGAML